MMTERLPLMEKSKSKHKPIMHTFRKNWADDIGVIHPPESVKTGFKVIDDVIHSYMPADLTVIIGHVSMGRTSFLLTSLYQIASRGLPVVYCTVQNRQYYIGRRILSFDLDYDVRMLTEMNNQDKRVLIKNILKSQKTLPAYVIDATAKAFNIDSMIERIYDLLKDEDVRLIMLDDPHLMEGKEKDILIRLKHFAIDTQIPVIVSIKAPDVVPMTPRKVISYLDETIVYIDNIITIERLEYPLKENKRHINLCPVHIIDVVNNRVESERLNFHKHLAYFMDIQK